MPNRLKSRVMADENAKDRPARAAERLVAALNECGRHFSPPGCKPIKTDR